MKNNFIIVETTCPNLLKAKKLAKLLLNEKLAACIHFLPISSIYFWQNKIENSKEILLRIKTTKNTYDQIEKTIISNHDYEIPQITVVDIKQGFMPYLQWIESNVKKGNYSLVDKF